MNASMQQSVFTSGYVDINSLYGLNASQELVLESAAINNSLYNLINCPRGSRFMLPEYGTNIYSYLHEPCDDITAKDILMDFIYAVNKWEPRIQLDLANSSVVAFPTKDGFLLTAPHIIKRLNRANSSRFRLNSIGS